MEMMNKVIILIAICVLWFWSFLLLPKTGEKVVYVYHFLALCSLIMIYGALVDPAGLCDTFFQIKHLCFHLLIQFGDMSCESESKVSLIKRSFLCIDNS